MAPESQNEEMSSWLWQEIDWGINNMNHKELLSRKLESTKWKNKRQSNRVKQSKSILNIRCKIMGAQNPEITTNTISTISNISVKNASK